MSYSLFDEADGSDMTPFSKFWFGVAIVLFILLVIVF
jgi:hypothetical protein